MTSYKYYYLDIPKVSKHPFVYNFQASSTYGLRFVSNNVGNGSVGQKTIAQDNEDPLEHIPRQSSIKEINKNPPITRVRRLYLIGPPLKGNPS